MKPEEEVHSPQFRGVWVPADVWHLLAEGKIDCTEFALLAYIEGLVKCRGEGCWASASTMSRVIGKSQRQVKRMIAKLKRLQLIRRVGSLNKHGRNHAVLETAWSRVQSFSVLQDTGPVTSRTPNIHTKSSLQSDLVCITNNSQRELSLSDSEVNMTDLFGNEPTDNNNKVVPEIKAAVNTLREFVNKQGWPISKSPKDWGVPLMTLGRQVGYDKVVTAINWYVKNHPDNIRMKIENGLKFRKHYMTVLWRMEGVEVVKIEADPILETTIETLAGLGWPKGSKKQLPAACQLTLVAIRGFREKLRLWYAGQPNKNVPHARLAKWLLEGGMPDSNVNFVHCWMEWVNGRIDYDRWSGNLIAMVPKPGLGETEFNKWGRGLAEEYSTGRLWDKLMGYVYGR